MEYTEILIQPKELASIYKALGADADLLTRKISHMPHSVRQVSPRAFAELREARALISSIKYPDSLQSIRRDELAWALKLVHESAAVPSAARLFETAAQLLKLDLSAEHPIPRDLDRRITNELAIVSRYNPHPSLQEAV